VYNTINKTYELQVSPMYLSLTDNQQIYPVVIAEGKFNEDDKNPTIFWA
jgi:hypothetical protein